MNIVKSKKKRWLAGLGLLALILLYPISWLFIQRKEETPEEAQMKFDALSHDAFTILP